jgi:predicted DNA repair protein MutK
MNTQPVCQERSLVGPMVMILVGIILLISQFVPNLGFDKLWPVLLIGGGVAALFGRR